jgi:hypothetical protein
MSYGRMKARTLGILFLALLLAAAAAAGAGDGIKWKRAKDLPYTPVEVSPTSFDRDFEEVLDEYTVEWRAPLGHDLNYIVATFFDWGLYCTYLQATVKDDADRDKKLEAAADEAREEYCGKFQFYVGLATRRIEWGRITNKHFWEVYLEVDGEKISPITMEPQEDEVKTSSRHYFWFNSPIGPAHHYYANKSYLLTFENPNGDTAPRSLKLVLLCEKARRGFEWRFKE